MSHLAALLKTRNHLLAWRGQMPEWSNGMRVNVLDRVFFVVRERHPVRNEAYWNVSGDDWSGSVWHDGREWHYELTGDIAAFERDAVLLALYPADLPC